MKNIIRGWWGEKKTAFYMWLWLNSTTYQTFHNVIIPAQNGTTQIDHLIISPFGVFIVETKNYSGWIYGSEDHPLWTHAFYHENYSIQNPLRQTYRQKKVLSEFLQLYESVIFPVVYFVGNCKIMTPLPNNVLNYGLIRYIKSFKDRVLSNKEINRLTHSLSNFLSQSKLSKKDHIRSLRFRHESKTKCPRCGGNLVERTTMKGPYAGNIFLGCENYPYCRFTKSIF